MWPLHEPCPTGAADVSGMVGRDTGIYHIGERAPAGVTVTHTPGAHDPSLGPQSLRSPGVGCRRAEGVPSQSQLSPFQYSLAFVSHPEALH